MVITRLLRGDRLRGSIGILRHAAIARWTLWASLSLFVLFLASCADSNRHTGKTGTGGITAHLVWLKPSPPGKIPGRYASTPPGVVTVHAEISGPGMDTLSKDSGVELHADAIGKVPVGNSRTLTLQGLDADGNILYEGTTAGITVKAGETADAGTVKMSPAVPGFAITPTSLITSEDGPAQTFTIRPKSDPNGKTITVAITSSDATEGAVSPSTLSWTSADFATAKTVTVTPLTDDVRDNTQTYTIKLNPKSSTASAYKSLGMQTVGVTNTDPDSPGFIVSGTTLFTSESAVDSPQSFTIRPTSAPLDGDDITVNIASSDLTEGTVDEDSLTWDSSNWEIAREVSVTPVDEDLPDGNQTYDITIDPSPSSDVDYGVLLVPSVSVTNSDDDSPGFTVTATTLSTSESSLIAQTFTIRPNTDPGLNTITVNIVSTDTTEGVVAGTCLVPLDAVLSWDNTDFEDAKAVSVTPCDDAIQDGNPTYEIQFDPSDSTDGDYAALVLPPVSVTNSDDDAAGFTITPTSLTTSEAALSAQTFTIRPNSDPGPGKTVRVDITVADTTEGIVAGTCGTPQDTFLSWNSSDFSTAKTVTVTPCDDAIDDGNRTYDVRLDPDASTSALYHAFAVQAVSVTNIDDDTAAFTITPASLTTSEASLSAQTFTIRPNSDPDADTITVDISSANETEGVVAGNCAVPLDTTLSWSHSDYTTAKTVTVTPCNDAIDDGNQTYNVRLDPLTSTSALYSALPLQTVPVTNSDDDTAGFTITALSLSTTEGGTAKTFTIRPNTDPGSGTVVVYASSVDSTEGTASPATLTWGHLDYTTAQTVTVTPVEDFIVDGAQNYTIELDPIDSTDPAYAALAIRTVAVSNADVDAIGVTVSPPSGTLTTEDGDSVTFTVVLTTKPNGNVVVSVVSLDTTEVAITSPLPVLGVARLTFTTTDWSTPQTVTLTGQDDGIADGNQNVTVRLTMDTGATADTTGYDGLDPADVLLTNLDNESPGVTVTPSSGLTTSESGLTDTFSVVLNTMPAGDVVIHVTSLDTTEVTVNKPTLTFTPANWSSPQVVTVAGVNDAAVDGNIVATIALTIDTGATTDDSYDSVEPGAVTVTNSDDDAPGVTVTPASGLATSESGAIASFTVVLNTPPDDDVVIAVAVSDVTEISVDTAELLFTTSDWSTPQTVTVTGLNDALQDGSQIVTVQLTIDSGNTLDGTGYLAINPPDVSVVNVDDDAVGITVIPSTTLFTTEGGGSATFTVLLNTEPDGNVVIDVTPADATELSVNKTTLTFTPSDWTTPQTVTVTGVDDALTDGNQTTVIDVVVDPVDTTDTTGYDGVAPIAVTVVNADNEVPGVTVLPMTGLVTSEGGATATFSVVLNTAPNNNVVILLFNDTPGEIAVDKTKLTFTTGDWATPQYVTLTGITDGLADGTQTTGVTLTMDTLLTTDTTGYDSVNPADVSGINLDNNVGVTVNPASGLVTSEAGTTATFSVVLNTQPNGNVVVNVVSDDTTEVAANKSVLTFTVDDWATPQIVTLTGVDDMLADGSPLVTVFVDINAGATTDSTGYDLIDPPDVTVTNVDDDSGGFTVTPTSGLVTTESGASATFTVRLNLPPNGNVVINVVSNDTTEVSTSVSSLTFTTSDWATPQTVTLTGVNDTTSDGDIAVNIALTVNAGLTTDTTGYASLNPDDVSVTNEDNESQGQGSAGTPVNLTGTLPASGSVGATASYYVVSGLTASVSYMVTTTSVSADLELYIYSDAGFTTEICPTTNNAFDDERPESCVVTAPGSGTLYIKVTVDGVFSPGGGTYSINVIPAPVAQGATGAPLNITGLLPYLGGVNGTAGNGNSYYVVNGLTASTNYRVQITNLTANMDLFVYSSVNFTGGSLLCDAPASSIAEACQQQSTAGGQLFIRVRNNNGSDGNPVSTIGAFTIAVMPPLSDEGSIATPVDLTGIMPYSGKIKTAASYYKVTGLVPNAAYHIEMINMAGQGALNVYSSSTYGGAATCSSDRGGNFPEFCTVNANGSGQLFFTANPGTGFSTAGATYTLQVK